MTAAVREHALGPEGRAGRIIVELAARGMRSVLRLPSAFIPATLFPVFLIVAFSGAFSGITLIPGFPTDEILNWYVPLAILQGSAFLGVGVGLSTTRDLESGFYDRLLLAPAPRWSLLAGPALGAVLRCLFPIYVVLVVGGLGGAHLEGNALGLLALLLAASGMCLIHAFWCLGLAFRFKSQRAAPIMQIGVFTTIFLATAQVPLSVMTGWLHAVARVNPMTNVLRLSRVGFLGEVTWSDSWPGLLVLVVTVALTLLFAVRGLQKLAP